MIVERPTYMLSPDWEILPTPDGPLTLGAIMVDARNPHQELNKGRRVSVAEADVTTTHKKHWTFTRSSMRSGTVGLWASIASSISGTGPEGSIEARRTALRSFKCAELETKYFQPSARYIAESLEAPFVAAFFAQNGWWKPRPVYMVTGVKIAKAAQVESDSGGSLTWSLKVGIDGTAIGAPVNFGPNGSYRTEGDSKEAFTAHEDFVVAYRLLRIKKKSKTATDFQTGDHNKWALFGDGNCEAADEGQAKQFLGTQFDIEDLHHLQSDSGFQTTSAVCLDWQGEDAEFVILANALAPACDQ